MPQILISTILYLLINVLFVDKYSARITEYHYAVDLGYLVLGVALFFAIRWMMQNRKEGHYKTLLIFGGIIYFILMRAVQYSIDPMTLQVDRWSAIHNFLYNLFHGIYPYAAQTHLGGYGSPFPVWQIIHIPFYLLGNVGLSFFVFLWLFLIVVAYYDSPKTAFICLLLIAFSPAAAYEVAVRSDLLTNFLGICTLCKWLQHKQIKLNNHVLLLGIIAGLCASTRLATLIPLGLLYGYSFLQIGWRKQCCFILTTLATFIVTFLPFLVWDFDQLLFFRYNPFVLQTRQGSPVILLLFATIAVGWAIYKKDHLQHFSLHAGGLLSLLVVITFTYNMLSSGDYNLFSSAYDITYFNMAMPFYIYTIAQMLNYESVSRTHLSSPGD